MNLKEEIIKLELDQAINTFKTQLTLAVNIITILTIADVSLTGYAIREKSTGILLIGTIFPVAIILISRMIKKLIAPVVFTGYKLEKKYGDNESLLITTFVHFISKSAAIALNEIVEKDSIEQPQLLKGSEKLFSLSGGNMFVKIMIVITLGQLLIPIFILWQFEWHIL